MRRRTMLVVLGILAALSLGGTCRQETAGNALNAFLVEIAATTGNAIGQALVDRANP